MLLASPPRLDPAAIPMLKAAMFIPKASSGLPRGFRCAATRTVFCRTALAGYGATTMANALLRQYFPEDTDLSRGSEQETEAVARTLSNRPRKTLGWKTPAETLNEYLESIRQPGVATTG